MFTAYKIRTACSRSSRHILTMVSLLFSSAETIRYTTMRGYAGTELDTQPLAIMGLQNLIQNIIVNSKYNNIHLVSNNMFKLQYY